MLPNATEIKVGIAEYKAASSPYQIITLGLGSCVGVTLYDPYNKIGGLVHVMLPDSTQFQSVTNPAKFADLGVPVLFNEMLKLGAKKTALQVKMAGGAQMFQFNNSKSSNSLNIGQRNIEMSKEVIAKLGLKIVGEETGGNFGRTMILDTSTGKVFIRTIGSPLRTI
ncbi:chemotaxis protein CheD [Bacillota bacterium LX-D]|nr:chemotaxis protein CheD [Bacillota bacterium LX-D]